MIDKTKTSVGDVIREAARTAGETATRATTHILDAPMAPPPSPAMISAEAARRGPNQPDRAIDVIRAATTQNRAIAAASTNAQQAQGKGAPRAGQVRVAK